MNLLRKEYKNFLKKVKKDTKVCIYGVGVTATGLKKNVENIQGAKVVFFADNVMKGEYEGLKVYSPLDLVNLKDEYDIIILGAHKALWRYIVVLKSLGIDNYVKIPLLAINNYKKQVISKDKIKSVLNILHTREDKTIFKMLVDAQIDSQRVSKIKKYASKRNFEDIGRIDILRQYIENINKDVIKTVIDAGFSDGITSLIFMSEFKNIEKIYGFDPMYENFKIDIFDEIIKSKKEIEIINLGLWDKKDILEFKEIFQNKNASAITEVRHFDEISNPGNIHKIRTISIDEFVEENNIKKVDFIKMDIEGAESKALLGAAKTILNHRPQLAISIYHSMQDYVDIPLYLNSILKDYIYKVGHYSAITPESVVYAIPKELYK